MANEGTTSTPSTENEPDETPETPDESQDDLGEGGKKALEAERTRAKAARQQLRDVQRELAAERSKNQTESERAIEAAKTAGRQEAAVEAGKRLARAEIRAAASEKGLDVAQILEDVDLSRFVGDDGEPDDRAISRAVARWAALTPSSRPRGDIDQGLRGGRAVQSPRDAFADLFQK